MERKTVFSEYTKELNNEPRWTEIVKEKNDERN